MSVERPIKVNLGIVYRFTSLGQILAYYQHANPARYKPINLLEPDRGGCEHSFILQIQAPDGSISYIDDRSALWGAVCTTIGKTLKRYGQETEEVKAFRLCYLIPKRLQMTAERIADGDYPKEIPESMRLRRCSDRTVFRYLSRIRKELEHSFRRAGMLPPDDQST